MDHSRTDDQWYRSSLVSTTVLAACGFWFCEKPELVKVNDVCEVRNVTTRRLIEVSFLYSFKLYNIFKVFESCIYFRFVYHVMVCGSVPIQ
jgi:hypothetical protein